MSLLLDAFTVVLVLGGAGFFLAGTVGLLRFPDSLSRLHALAKADTLGLGLIVLGLLPQVGGLTDALKLLLVLALAAFGSATASQIVARVARAEEAGEPASRPSASGPPA